MDFRKSLLMGTLACALAVFGVITYLREQTPVQIEATNLPTLGNKEAPVEVVLIEDFQCKNCKAFAKKLLAPLIQDYVEEGKVRFVLLPISFLPGSQVVANAILEVFHQNPSQCFLYLQDVLNQEDVKIDDLLRFAKRREGIDVEKLQTCIDLGCHRKELEQNFQHAQEIMGEQLRTPTLYINGAFGSTYSFEAVKYQIERILKP